MQKRKNKHASKRSVQGEKMEQQKSTARHLILQQTLGTCRGSSDRLGIVSKYRSHSASVGNCRQCNRLDDESCLVKELNLRETEAFTGSQHATHEKHTHQEKTRALVIQRV